MTTQEAIETIKTAIAEVEWEYPMDYAAAFDMAIEALTHFNATSNSIKTELSCSEEPNRSDLISRQMAIDALGEQLDYLQMLNKDENPTAESKWYGVNWARNTIADLPSAEPEVKPISYTDCANAMLMMWMDEVLTDGEYNRIMDKLNAYEMKKREENG